MTSIRRTLSPVPRPGTSLNGEACLVASPLSRSSQSPQNYPPSGGLLSSLFSPPEKRSKTKVSTWRRSLFHFSIFFVFGMFLGFTPFASDSFSRNLMSQHHAFLFEMNSAVENLQTYVNVGRNTTTLDSTSVKNSSDLDPPQQKKWGLIDLNSDYSTENDSLSENTTAEVRNLLIIVTPTSSGPFQAYYLNRLAQTLKLASPPLLWMVVEMNSQSPETANILRSTGVVYRHLVCNKNVSEINDRKVHQRNAALSHIELHRLDGIVYFADGESIYSVDLFEQIRIIRRFGTWKVAKVTEPQRGAMLEGPVCNESQVIGWHLNGSKRRSRRFHAELSGFAFNSTILWDPKRRHRPTAESIRQLDEVKENFQVSNLIEQIVEDESQMEGLPPECSRIMVWDPHLEPANPLYLQTWLMKNNRDATDPLLP